MCSWVSENINKWHRRWPLAAGSSCRAFQAVMKLVSPTPQWTEDYSAWEMAEWCLHVHKLGLLQNTLSAQKYRWERSILALRAGSRSTSQASPVLLIHNNTQKSVLCLPNVGSWLTSKETFLFFQGCNLHILSMTTQGNKHVSRAEEKPTYGRTQRAKEAEENEAWTRSAACHIHFSKSRWQQMPIKCGECEERWGK